MGALRIDDLDKVFASPLSGMDEKTFKFIAILIGSHPASFIGKTLANRLGGKSSGHAFASVCFQFLRANEALAPYGWQVIRSGGLPESSYVLRPIP